MSAFKTPTWSDEFQLPDRLYLISDIQDYFQYVLKNMVKLLMIHQSKYM